MGNPLEALRAPGHTGKVDFGSPEVFGYFPKNLRNQKNLRFPNFRASEIDFSGVSGASEYIFWIPHPLEPQMSIFSGKLTFAQSRILITCSRP